MRVVASILFLISRELGMNMFDIYYMCVYVNTYICIYCMDCRLSLEKSLVTRGETNKKRRKEEVEEEHVPIQLTIF